MATATQQSNDLRNSSHVSVNEDKLTHLMNVISTLYQLAASKKSDILKLLASFCKY